MSDEPLIGGIPARLFVGRTIRFKDRKELGENKQHFMPAKLLRLLGRKRAEVQPSGHKRGLVIRLSGIHPWWSENPDLRPSGVPAEEEENPVFTPPESWFKPKEEAATPPREEQAPESKSQPMIAQAFKDSNPAVPIRPVAKPPASPKKTFRHPKMTVSADAGADWMASYREYLQAGADLQAMLEMADEQRVKLAGCQKALEGMGVTFEAEFELIGGSGEIPRASGTGLKRGRTLPAKPGRPAAYRKTSKTVGGQRMVASTRRKLDQWFLSLPADVQAGVAPPLVLRLRESVGKFLGFSASRKYVVPYLKSRGFDATLETVHAKAWATGSKMMLTITGKKHVPQVPSPQ